MRFGEYLQGNKKFKEYSFMCNLTSSVICPSLTGKNNALIHFIPATYSMNHKRALNALHLEQYRRIGVANSCDVEKDNLSAEV